MGEITPVSNIGEGVFALGDPGMAIENQLFADSEIGEAGYKLIDSKGQPVRSDVGDAVPVRFPYLRSSRRCRSPSRRLVSCPPRSLWPTISRESFERERARSSGGSDRATG